MAKTCSCGATIVWLKTREGGSMPVRGPVKPWPPGGFWYKELGSHWDDCPDREQYRRDTPPAPRHPRGFFLDLRQLADTIEGVDIYVSGTGSSWSAFWQSGEVPVSSHGHESVEAAVEAARAYFAERVLMPWPWPEPSWADAFAAWPVDELEAQGDQAEQLLEQQALEDLAPEDVLGPGFYDCEIVEMPEPPPLLEIHVAGVCRKPRGPGGWGCVLVSGDRRSESAGYLAQTTLSHATLVGLRKAVKSLSRFYAIEIYTSCPAVGLALRQGLERAAEMPAPDRVRLELQGALQQLEHQALEAVHVLDGQIWPDASRVAHNLANAEALRAETLIIEGIRA